MICEICGRNKDEIRHRWMTQQIYAIPIMGQIKLLIFLLSITDTPENLLYFVEKHLPYLYEKYIKLSILQ
jgi:hypothetical protein